jgi:hypothetical protein
VLHCEIYQLIHLFLYAILHVTSTLSYVYFNNFIDTHFIILLLGIITKSQTSTLIVKKGLRLTIRKETSYSDQTQDLFNILLTKLNKLLSPLL